MAVSTVQLNGTTIMTVNDTTAIASDVASSKYFYSASGQKTLGANSGGGGGGSATLITKSIAANGTYSASNDSADGYSSVTVNVPNSYAAGDEGKVVHNGALTSQTSATYTTNNTYDTTLINSVTVNVSGGGGGLTSHEIHLEFDDSTDADIAVDYNNSILSSIITAYSPNGEWTYNNKTVVLAQLDNVTWYTYTPIPLNTQLVDSSTCTYGYSVGENGALYEQEWCYVTDYIPIRPTMTFSYRNYYWFYIGFYNESQVAVGGIYVMTDGTQDPDDGNTGYGTLDSTKIPASAKYVRLCGAETSSSYISLIRTA